VLALTATKLLMLSIEPLVDGVGRILAQGVFER
jgi:hypothetical protein